MVMDFEQFEGVVRVLVRCGIEEADVNVGIY